MKSPIVKLTSIYYGDLPYSIGRIIIFEKKRTICCDSCFLIVEMDKILRRHHLFLKFDDWPSTMIVTFITLYYFLEIVQTWLYFKISSKFTDELMQREHYCQQDSDSKNLSSYEEPQERASTKNKILKHKEHDSHVEISQEKIEEAIKKIAEILRIVADENISKQE